MGPIHSNTIGLYNNNKKSSNIRQQKTRTLILTLDFIKLNLKITV